MAPDPIVAPGFEKVREELEAVVADDPTYSAWFAAYADGEQVLDIWAGPDAEPDTIQGVFSSTKGVSAISVALLLQRGAFDLDEPLARYWPEFGQAGKQDMSIRVALSHQGGLPGVEPQFTLDQLLDHDYTAARLAAQSPHWRPGKAHGYHGLTIGILMDQLVRHTDGRPIAQFFRDEIGDPRGIDFYIATPEEQEERVVDVLTLIPTAEQADMLRESPMRRSPDTITGMAFNAATGPIDDPPISNLRKVRAAGLPAASGVGSARGLARLYATATMEVDGLPRLLTAETVEKMAQIQTVGEDLVLRVPTRYGIVFQKADDRLWYGSHQAFGHDGAGGAMGIADPWHDVAWGYVPRRMSFPGGADDRGMSLAQTMRQCAADRRS
jgi:CubicO group peptidase (beta-lactamase class C family)